MLDGRSSVVLHQSQDVVLILLSAICLVPNLLFMVFSELYSFILQPKVIKERSLKLSDPSFTPRTVLVTGVGMTKGLFLARLFYQAGYTVIGADFEPGNLPIACGRVSKSLSKFYRLSKPTSSGDSAPYVQTLLDIIDKENVDLWVSCSGVASAVEDGEAKEIIEARTGCKAIQFDVPTTQTLHEKDTFIEKTKEIGLATPETIAITSRQQVETHLRDAPKSRKYIMKTVGVDDSVRADMTLLPRPSPRETSEHIARLRISKANPWILQQFIQGSEFCTHSLVIDGQVRAFVACPSAELLMHYEALPDRSPLSQAMLEFTRTYAKHYGRGFTGHLSFDFLIEEQDLTKPNKKDITLYPIECNPRAHTAVCLFRDTPAMVDAYLSLLGPGTAVQPSKTANGSSSPPAQQQPISPIHSNHEAYYWLPHDILTLFLLPVLSFLLLQSSLAQTLTDLHTFLTHVLTWRDGTFEIWDPWPYFWLYHVFWPARFLDALYAKKKWSRVNVSTTKMFMC